jgi:hypothetical protein
MRGGGCICCVRGIQYIIRFDLGVSERDWIVHYDTWGVWVQDRLRSISRRLWLDLESWVDQLKGMDNYQRAYRGTRSPLSLLD